MKSEIMLNPHSVIAHVDRGFYNESCKLLEAACTQLTSVVHQARQECCRILGRDPVAHWKFRVKAAASTRNKLEQLGYPPTETAALQHLHDLLGVRLVCTYIDDVYELRDMLMRHSAFMPVRTKDYVHSPKPNGYRSLHLIGLLDMGERSIKAEIQIRTLAMDCWATLEHQLRYKSDGSISPLLIGELKRCADEMASTDWNLQAIRELTTQGEAGTPI